MIDPEAFDSPSPVKQALEFVSLMLAMGQQRQFSVPVNSTFASGQYLPFLHEALGVCFAQRQAVGVSRVQARLEIHY